MLGGYTCVTTAHRPPPAVRLPDVAMGPEGQASSPRYSRSHLYSWIRVQGVLAAQACRWQAGRQAEASLPPPPVARGPQLVATGEAPHALALQRSRLPVPLTFALIDR